MVGTVHRSVKSYLFVQLALYPIRKKEIWSKLLSSTLRKAHSPFLDSAQRELVEGLREGANALVVNGRNRSVADVSPLEMEVAKLIIRTLTLKVDPAQIQPEAPLFGDGLGLDSIDALELSLAISQSYGHQIRSDDPDTVATFASLRSLCQSIEKHRTK